MLENETPPCRAEDTGPKSPTVQADRIQADQIHIDANKLSAELAELATFSNAPPAAAGTAVTRVVFSEQDRDARAWLKDLAAHAGLETREDAVGNTFFRWSGADPDLPAIATGSHIDAIPHAGMYDGTVGVLGGLEAMRALRRSGFRPRRSIDLVLFTSEEPTRFGIGCLGSRLLAGVLTDERAATLRDPNGATLNELRAASGFRGPLSAVPLSPGHYSAWIELHIEQGPLLERENLPLGIVTGIAAPAGYRFEITGLGGHAGALLMPDRRDALCAAAEVILSVERRTLATGAIDTVATVGTCQVHPGAVNSVPSHVALELDLRDTDPVRREQVIAGIRTDIAEIASERRVSITEQIVNADQPAACSPGLVALLESSANEIGAPFRRMVSRAYHDSLFMARIAPIGMLFIPCREGVSHRPEEYASPEDIALGARVLALALAKLASV